MTFIVDHSWLFENFKYVLKAVPYLQQIQEDQDSTKEIVVALF